MGEEREDNSAYIHKLPIPRICLERYNIDIVSELIDISLTEPDKWISPLSKTL